jgi:RND family efflux transporter MFP subunit
MKPCPSLLLVLLFCAPARLSAQDEPGGPRTPARTQACENGVVSVVFVDNQIDPQTGTVRVRALLENDDHRFTPGMFARVKLLSRQTYNALLVNDSAVGTDQDVKYVLVVGPQNTVEYRAVQLGPVVDGLRVIRQGLEPGELVVVNGLQRVRPGVVIAPHRVAMGERPEQIETLAQVQGPPR